MRGNDDTRTFVEQVVEGMARGHFIPRLRADRCETAEMPVFNAAGIDDLSVLIGSCWAREFEETTRSSLSDLPSRCRRRSFTRNGYSLAAQTRLPARGLHSGNILGRGQQQIGAELRRPALLHWPMLKTTAAGWLSAMAHITRGHPPKFFPGSCRRSASRNRTRLMALRAIFPSRLPGKLERDELLRTFNMAWAGFS